jgi:hypothetical protein
LVRDVTAAAEKQDPLQAPDHTPTATCTGSQHADNTFHCLANLANPAQVRELQLLRTKLAAQDAANVTLYQTKEKAVADANAARADLRKLQDNIAPLHTQIR